MILKNERHDRIASAGLHVIAALCGGLLIHAAVAAGLLDAAAQPAPHAADTFEAGSGDLVVSQVRQMSVVIESADGVIYTDPTGGGARYAGHPPPDVILISHEHQEHYDPQTLEDLVRPDTRIVVPPYVMERLPSGLRASATVLANGEAADLGAIGVAAIPAYGLAGPSEAWHPRGRGNGYVVTVDDRRLYFAGSTDAIPEMLALEDIFLAFLPLYPPYALGPDDAADAVQAFRPEFTYIYQYNNLRTRDTFVRLVAGTSLDETVVAPEIDG